nr:hypothetical protein [uncultured Dysosmobacter sp.]
MIELQDQIALASFIAGFRLSGGIAVELSADEPYSFEKEEEKSVSKSLEENTIKTR